ncbi:MAG: hypothetical protein FK734_02090 [Asgard group archaeon]|nr:hypothetical protein [Asgard group archaeon]
MSTRIQIAPLKKDFQRIIDFDRKNPASKIVVFVVKSDTQIKSVNYRFIESALKKLREYCQLAKIEFNMQVIDNMSDKSFLEIILDFTRAILLDFKVEDHYLLNLGDDSLFLNISLFQAIQIIQGIYTTDIEFFITDLIEDQEIIYQRKLSKTFLALFSEPVSLDLLNCVQENKNLDGIKDSLNISLGTASNYLKQLKELELITIEGHDRSLTELGVLVRGVFEMLKQKT